MRGSMYEAGTSPVKMPVCAYKICSASSLTPLALHNTPAGIPAPGVLAAAWADFDAALCELEAAALGQAPVGTITLLPSRYGARR